jgi:hypothetical protein
MKNDFCSATSLSGSAALPFVISTEAKRSGEICGSAVLLGNVFAAAGTELKLQRDLEALDLR